MTAARRATVLEQIYPLVVTPGVNLDTGDDQLLERFVEERDGAAFAALLQRHGRMVLGVSRQLLADQHAAEDVFQATFLLLAQKASSIRKRTSVSAWLYGVARRMALKMRRRSRLRQEREARASSPPATE